MATRIYLSDAISTALEPEFSASWDVTSWATRRGMATTKGYDEGNGIAYLTGEADTGGSTPQNVLIRQYITAPISGAQTIEGNFKGQMGAKQGSAGHDSCRAVIIRVFSGDGLTERGVLYSDLPDPLESEFAYGDWWTTPWVNRYFPPEAAMTPVEAEDGDVIVVEVGFVCYGALVGSPIAMLTAYDAAEDDLPEDETTEVSYTGGAPDDYNSWLELSQDIEFEETEPPPGSIYEVVGSGGMTLSGTGTVGASVPVPLAIVGSGGMSVGGAGAIAEEKPGSLEIEGDGGFGVGGRGTILFWAPEAAVPSTTLSIVGSGGMEIGGVGVISDSEALVSLANDLNIVGYGGLAIGGAGLVEFPEVESLAIVGSGGFKIGGFRVPELSVVEFLEPADLSLIAGTTPVALVMGGEGVVGEVRPESFEVPTAHASEDAPLQIGGAGIITFISPQILEIIGQGELFLGTEPTEDEAFDTLVLNGIRHEPSIFSNFNFNSFATFEGKNYGARSSGVYLLEGEDDAGQEIHSGVRIATNFGTDRIKRLRALRCGEGTSRVQVRVSIPEGEAEYFEVDANGRVPISRKIQGRELTVEIVDFDVMNHLEIIPMIIGKR